MKSLFLLLALLFVAPAAPALQGSGIGTLPRTGAQRNVGWLSAWQRVTFERQDGAQFVIGSTHDAEENLYQETPPEDPQIYRASWTWRGIKMEVITKRWVSEHDADGARRWFTRHASAVTEAMYHWPPDQFVFGVPDRHGPRALCPIRDHWRQEFACTKAA